MTTSSLPNPDLAEEIDAINAIYDLSTITLTTTTTTSTTSSSSDHILPIQTTIILRIPDHEHLPSFLLGFDAQYPSTPPRVLGTATTSARGEGKKWVDVLCASVRAVWTPGSVCLFDVIGDVGERVEIEGANNDDDGDDEDTGLQEGVGGLDLNNNDDGDDDGNNNTTNGTTALESPPDWTFSSVVTEKRSVFVARAARVDSRAQAERYLDHLLATEKKVAAATHNITAWRVREKTAPGMGTGAGDVRVFQDFDDDGETAAGSRMLHLMQLMDVWDVVVVVTRWFGGVKLGPDRFRLINGAARDALVRGGFERGGSSAAAAGGPEKGKKKGKK